MADDYRMLARCRKSPAAAPDSRAREYLETARKRTPVCTDHGISKALLSLFRDDSAVAVRLRPHIIRATALFI
jgi:hypothetical protein